MKDPKSWREAILRRAVEKNQTPKQVLTDWLPYIKDPPTTCSLAEAHRLGKMFPFPWEQILGAFNIERW